MTINDILRSPVRVAWLANLKVGDKMTWLSYGSFRPDANVRSIHTIVRETPTRWVLDRSDGMQVEKKTGRIVTLLPGSYLIQYSPDHETRLRQQQLDAAREDEKRSITNALGRLSLNRLREIAKANNVKVAE